MDTLLSAALFAITVSSARPAPQARKRVRNAVRGRDKKGEGNEEEEEEDAPAAAAGMDVDEAGEWPVHAVVYACLGVCLYHATWLSMQWRAPDMCSTLHGVWE